MYSNSLMNYPLFDSFFEELFYWGPQKISAKKISLDSDSKRTQILYSIPGVEKERIRVYTSNDNTEDGYRELVVEISEKPGGGLGSEYKREVFALFSYDDEEKISTSLKNGVLEIVIPKKDYSESDRVIREIPVS